MKCGLCEGDVEVAVKLTSPKHNFDWQGLTCNDTITITLKSGKILSATVILLNSDGSIRVEYHCRTHGVLEYVTLRSDEWETITKG